MFVNVPQVYAQNIRVGAPAHVTVRGHLAEPVAGGVTRTANALDPATRTLLTEVDIPNPSQTLLPGTFVYVSFNVAPSGTRWRIPATAVIVNAQGTRVAVIGDGNTIRFRPVTLGRDFGESIDIQAGLQGNETLVTQPTVSLKEGQVVRPLEPKSTP